MLARLAENLFWTGRYLERAEDTMRLVDVTHHLLLEAPPEVVERSWGEVLDQLHLRHPFDEWHDGDGPSTAAVLRYLMIEADNPSSVLSSVTAVRENARSVRELISAEVWEATNDLYLTLSSRDLEAELDDRPFEVFRTVKRGCQMVLGATTETMPRDDAYRFLTLGRMLERAEMTSRVVEVRLAAFEGVIDPRLRVALLRAIGALESYRRRFGGSNRADDVLALLLLDASHPRSVLFALDRAEEQFEHLGGDGRSRRALGRARASLRYRDVAELREEGLAEFLDGLQVRVRETSLATAAEYFRHTPPGAMHAVASA